jgi:hypothetical protein
MAYPAAEMRPTAHSRGKELRLLDREFGGDCMGAEHQAEDSQQETETGDPRHA